MSTERETVITRLRQEMKESPLPAISQPKPTHRVFPDGYERQTAEEPLQMTEKYRHRTARKIIKLIIIVCVVALLTVAVIKAGIISI